MIKTDFKRVFSTHPAFSEGRCRSVELRAEAVSNSQLRCNLSFSLLSLESKFTLTFRYHIVLLHTPIFYCHFHLISILLFSEDA